MADSNQGLHCHLWFLLLQRVGISCYLDTGMRRFDYSGVCFHRPGGRALPQAFRPDCTSPPLSWKLSRPGRYVTPQKAPTRHRDSPGLSRGSPGAASANHKPACTPRGRPAGSRCFLPSPYGTQLAELLRTSNVTFLNPGGPQARWPVPATSLLREIKVTWFLGVMWHGEW